MAKKLLLIVPLLLAVSFAFLPPAPTPTVANVTDFGAKGDGNPSNVAANTIAFQQAIATGNTVYVPVGRFVVNNGAIRLTTAGQKIYGESTMGANPSWGATTSVIVGKGQGHTISTAMVGCCVQGLSFMPQAPGEQRGQDAYIEIENTQCWCRDITIQSPNIGIAVKVPEHQGGQFWVRDVLMQGRFGVAGISIANGGGTAQISHCIMFADPPQPPYGILVTSAGELQIDNGCDIINCGACLALVPGLGGIRDQEVTALSVTSCLFDSGNGPGCVWIHPTNRAYILKSTFTDVWASTGSNPGNTNGFTIDGADSTPAVPALKSIQNVKFIGCVSKSFRGHCGWYCRKVDALSLIGCTAGDNFNGCQITPDCTNWVISGNSFGNFVPPSTNAGGGNQAYGLYLEPSQSKGIATGNMLTGNGFGGIFSVPSVNQVVGQNVQ